MKRLRKNGLASDMIMFPSIANHASYRDIMRMSVLSFIQSYELDGDEKK